MNDQNKTYVVVTTMEDSIVDVILITTDEAQAQEVSSKVADQEPIEGFDYNLLGDYDDAQYFSRTLNSLKNWEPDTSET